ncbi:pyridoxamine 5'-phosphate oxidase family protein [Telmatospirillum sp.]|uniref:pyridoxamine 5'-phosphate oxidase family protein n=1 Tax=Telmatospirillum sp. TaxID=2079197 RepID=UPI00284A1EE7|nr:pyridoxamine 5'-phosphate oxidase family protein [Telmatospirillum sp.]MDR3440144.1 pyridoxamine 5'-phosphate oxidase family protein [Telmatospirillum sp.]
MNIIGEIAAAPNWHQGERVMQQLAGADQALAQRRFSRSLPPSHQHFVAGRSFIVAGTLNGAGWPWASIATGPAGFVSCPDPRTLVISTKLTEGDPLAELVPGAPVGLLAIDFGRRLRIRVNGRVSEVTEKAFSITIDQSYGNCPKYIEPPEGLRPFADPKPIAHFEPVKGVTEEMRRLIGRSSMFFVASGTGTNSGTAPWGADASFRGGPVGFVDMGTDGRMTIPDYPGNNYFNTLGNLLIHPRAGMTFADFANGDLLLLSGEADVFARETPSDTTTDVERFWTMTPRHGRWIRNGLGMVPGPDDGRA